jgi:hypothetical protein
MSDGAETVLPGPGHNSPPTFAEELAAEVKPFRDRADALIDSLSKSKIDGPENAAAVTTLGNMLADLRAKVEAARKVRAEPFDDGKKAVQTAFKAGLIDPLDAASETARKMVDEWRRKLEADAAAERRKRDEEAAAAQRAADEAERKKQEAEKVGDIGATIKAEMEELQARDRAAVLSSDEGTIRPDAMIRGAGGGAAATTTRVPVITNIGECLAWMLVNQRQALVDAITPIIGKMVRAKVDIPGVEVKEETSTRFRRG